MFKFVKVAASYLNNESYWALLIETPLDLFEYFDAKSPQLIRAYFELKHKHTKYGDRLGHYVSNNEEYAVHNLFIRDHGNKTMADDICTISDAFNKTKLDLVLAGEKLLINPTGIGFCWFDPKYHTILEQCEKSDFVFPCEMTEKDIIVKQWENGTHWYVRVGNYDLPDRYNTYEAGMAAGKKYLEKE